jgi:hypothetical protein
LRGGLKREEGGELGVMRGRRRRSWHSREELLNRIGKVMA